MSVQSLTPRRSAVLLAALTMMLGTATFAEAAGGAPTAQTARAEASTQSGSAGGCADPHPCGYRWEGPAGPYPVRATEQVLVPSFDGTTLSGFVKRPDLPADVRVPVILQVTPYLTPDAAPATFSVGNVAGDVWVAEGYAVAVFSSRGTGDSGGCFGEKSQDEQKDLPVVIDWLAKQPWSNGRVAMAGLSYAGTTPIMAAIQNPPALKTILPAGIIVDEYTWFYSHQGAAFEPALMTVAGPGPSNTLFYSLPPSRDPAKLATTTERFCEELVEANSVFPLGEVSGDRNAPYWTDRRFIDGMPGIKAATFVVHGFGDRYSSGHAFQEDFVWQTLNSAPKRMLIGQWGHTWPSAKAVPDWKQQMTAWFDYWLKGWGETAPGLGTVRFEDDHGGWHSTDAWPPPVAKGASGGNGHLGDADAARRHDEVLYLSSGSLAPKPAREKASFLDVLPPWTGPTGAGGPLSPDLRWTTPCPDPLRLVYLSDAVEQRTLVAGNPFAMLDVDSSAPGGTFELQLYDIGPGFTCDGLPQTEGDIRPISEGAVDLRFHAWEDYRAHPYTPLTRTPVRVDMTNLAEVLEPGHRLGLVISHGFWRGGLPEMSPVISLHGDGTINGSHLVLPVVTGGFGAQAPTLTYPPTPFVPRGDARPAA